MTGFDAIVNDLFAECERSAVRLEMRDVYEPYDSGYYATAEGVRLRRARIVSEPLTEYIKFEHRLTGELNLAAGELVRWLPRHSASDLALPGNDFWLFDDKLVLFQHFSGDGRWVGVEPIVDPATVQLCATAFEAVWQRAIDHAEYAPA